MNRLGNGTDFYSFTGFEKNTKFEYVFLKYTFPICTWFVNITALFYKVFGEKLRLAEK